jgi:hypothetical protein
MHGPLNVKFQLLAHNPQLHDDDDDDDLSVIKKKKIPLTLSLGLNEITSIILTRAISVSTNNSQAYVLKQSHITLVLSIYSRLHVSALTVSHQQAFYKLRSRKNYTMHKKEISSITLKIHYKRIKTV